MRCTLALFFIFHKLSSIAQIPCSDSLKPISFPCCVSGIDWSEEEKALYIVSDLINKVYLAKVDTSTRSATVYDSLFMIGVPHTHGLEAIRKVGSVFYLSFEKDEWENGVRKARAFVSKGKQGKDKTIYIEKTISFEDLPNNKGIEGLTLTADKNHILISHESMSRPKNGLDSVKFITLDTALNIVSFLWYPIRDQTFFDGNTAAYNDYGVTEVLTIRNSLYVLERGWGKKEGKGEVFISIFKLPNHSFKKNSPLYSFSSKNTPTMCLDNFEGLCYLPSLGKILIVSDDNNQKKIQKTRIQLLDP